MPEDRLNDLTALKARIEHMHQTGMRAYGVPAALTADDDRYCSHGEFSALKKMLDEMHIPYEKGGSGEGLRSLYVTLGGTQFNVFALGLLEHECYRLATIAVREMIAAMGDGGEKLRADKRTRVTVFVAIREALRCAMMEIK